MTTDARNDEYRDFLESQPVTILRDWALHLAREHRDVGFLWDLSKFLPDTQTINTDWAAENPIDAVRELVHLVTHFREEAASPEVADLLKARYVDYLAEHADEQRFDGAEPRDW
jgi:hypothetical protein